MSTSGERPMVAARLRSGIIARNIPEAYVAIVQSIGVRPCLRLHDGESGDRFDSSAYEAALDRLADLIDPTCQMKSIPKSSYRVCSRCGAFVRRDAVTSCTEVIPVRHCPNCGARVVDDD